MNKIESPEEAEQIFHSMALNRLTPQKQSELLDDIRQIRNNGKAGIDTIDTQDVKAKLYAMTTNRLTLENQEEFVTHILGL